MKRIIFTVFLIMLLALTACSSTSSRMATGSATQAGSPAELSTALKLLAGSFKLEGTGQAITPEQASELLPLWYVYEDISVSDTAAQEEKDALVNQIRDTMTAGQMSAIQAMNLTRRDVMTLMQEQGISSSVKASGTQTSGGMGGFPGGGGSPPGGFPGGGEFSGDSERVQARNGNTSASANASAMDTSGLVEALIELLNQRAQAR